MALVLKNLPANAGGSVLGDVGWIPGLGRSPGGGMATTPVFLPGESHGERNLADYSPRGRKELTWLN